MKALYLLRHAKSSWDDPARPDHERPLAGRGRKAGTAIGRYLADNGIAPQLVLCSTAKRARQTLERLGAAIAGADIHYEDALYDASATQLLERLRAVEHGVESVLLVGHNPAIQALVLKLAAPGDARDEVVSKYPTGALAALRWEGSWAELGATDVELAQFVRPRDLV
jgi:phosphohistidine phosphatase